jgi:hypothetical protein
MPHAELPSDLVALIFAVLFIGMFIGAFFITVLNLPFYFAKLAPRRIWRERRGVARD